MQYSIVMPVYKRSEIISLSLNSILSQSFAPLELIIVDNNTKDKETKKLKKIINDYSKKTTHPIIYKKCPKNSGALARNMGAAVASGDLIAFLDSDVVLDFDYYETLAKYFDSDDKLIAIQGLDRSLLEVEISRGNSNTIKKLTYHFEQIFETSLLFNKKKPYVSPSLAIAHPSLADEFELYSEWISTCAGIFKKSLFKKYKFPEQFITYSNNEYLMFSYQLYKNDEGKMIYTSKAKYKDIQTNNGRINRIELMYQIQTYDLYIFIRVFKINFKNIIIFIKSRIGHLLFYQARLIIKKEFSLNLFINSIGSIFYPFFHFYSIIKGDLSFYERDFPIK